MSKGDEKLFKSHPILDLEWPPLTVAQIEELRKQPGGEDLIAEHEAERQKRINMALTDPLLFGFDLVHWKDARSLIAKKDEIYALGGNGSAKTHFGGKFVSEVMHAGEGKKVLCVARSDQDSVTYQQTSVYDHLTVGERAFNGQAKKRRGVITKINYTLAGGFTEGTFVLPNRSQCWFKTLAQYERDPYSFEGPEYDLVWIDEGASPGLVDTLRFRVAKRAGKILFTFTAVHGYDAVCGEALEGAKVIRSLPMDWDWMVRAEGAGGGLRSGELGARNPKLAFPELKMTEVQVKGLPEGHMPYIMQPLDFNKGVIFMWTHWNPFLPRGKWNEALPAPFDKCVGRAKWQVRVRLFGYVEKMVGAAISNFNPTVHVIPHERIEALLKAGKLTTYMSADPAGRSYFLQWCGVDHTGTRYIFDESPTVEEGEWVTKDGDLGDGQNVYQGKGVKWYKSYIRARERDHGCEAERRFGDPRYFATAVQGADGGENLFDLFAKDGSDEKQGNNGMESDLAAMIFEPARIRQTAKEDVEVIVDLLAYDTDKDLSAENSPKLFISDRCRNTIRAWINWNGKASAENGRPNPYKDPVDTGRYLFAQELFWIDTKVTNVSGGGGWG